MIKPEDVASLCSTIATTKTNFYNEVPSAINAFVNKQNEIWCSQSAQAFANEVKDVLDADLKAIVESLNNIDKSLGDSAKGYSGVEIIDDSGYSSEGSFVVPTSWTAPLASMNKRLPGGYIGLLENATVGDLESSFDQIVVALGNLIANVDTENKRLNAFGPEEKERWVNELSALKNKIDGGLSSLKESLKTRVANEDRVRSELRSANEQIVSGISDSISMS